MAKVALAYLRIRIDSVSVTGQIYTQVIIFLTYVNF